MRTIKKFTEMKYDSPYYTKENLLIDMALDCDYTVLTSVRNIGKSYSAMCYAGDLINMGKTVVWERYNKDEYQLAKNTLVNFFPDYVDISKGSLTCLQNEESGGKIYIVQTSTANNLKGYDEKDYDSLPVLEIKDEFLPIRYNNSTRLTTEYFLAMEIRKTFKRNGPMRSLYLGNNLNWLNPYTMNWTMPLVSIGERVKVIDTYKLKFNEEEITSDRTILWHSIKPSEQMLKRIFSSEVASLNQDSLEEYFSNEFYKEYSCIGKCPDMQKPLAKYEIMSENYFIGIREYNGKLYFCHINHDVNKPVYVSETVYVDVDKGFIKLKSMGAEFENLLNTGFCIFDSQKTYFAFFRWIINLRKRV